MVRNLPLFVRLLTAGCQETQSTISRLGGALGRGMQLATWNCAMALHRKFHAMLRLQPNIAVICESDGPIAAS
jgi:hypothetical protein